MKDLFDFVGCLCCILAFAGACVAVGVLIGAIVKITISWILVI